MTTDLGLEPLLYGTTPCHVFAFVLGVVIVILIVAIWWQR